MGSKSSKQSGRPGTAWVKRVREWDPLDRLAIDRARDRHAVAARRQLRRAVWSIQQRPEDAQRSVAEGHDLRGGRSSELAEQTVAVLRRGFLDDLCLRRVLAQRGLRKAGVLS